MRITILSILLMLICTTAYGTSPDQLLINAIRDGKGAEIKNAIQNGADINSDGTNVDPALPPLIYAILLNNPGIVAMLINQGADPNLDSARF